MSRHYVTALGNGITIACALCLVPCALCLVPCAETFCERCARQYQIEVLVENLNLCDSKMIEFVYGELWQKHTKTTSIAIWEPLIDSLTKQFQTKLYATRGSELQYLLKT